MKFLFIKPKVFYTLHTDAPDRLNGTTAPSSVFRHSHNMVRMATRGFGGWKIAEALGVPLSTTQRWLQRLRSDGVERAQENVGRQP